MFDLIQESYRLISLRSDGERGTREVAEYLRPFCEQLGFQGTLQSASNGRGGRDMNLIAHTVPAKGKDLCPEGLLWVTHLDTVPAGDTSLWTETGGNPFQATIKAGKIYGLGSADTKLDILCKLLAVHKVGLQNIKVPFVLVGTFGEERALAGIRLIKESGILHPRWALVSEPSLLQPVIAHKGILYMRAVFVGAGSSRPGASTAPLQTIFKGRAAHGSMPHLGENAIEKAVAWVFEEAKKNPCLQLINIRGGEVHNIVPDTCEIEVIEGESPCPRIQFLEKFFEMMVTARQFIQEQSNTAFEPPHTTVNIGVIRGDVGKIEIEFDFRLIPETDGNALFEIFHALKERPGARIEVIRSNAPMRTEPDSEVAQKVSKALRETGLPVKWSVKSGNTEGAILSEMGVETIVIGPGRSVGNIHAPNEHTEITQLEKAVKFYTAFLRQFC